MLTSSLIVGALAGVVTLAIGYYVSQNFFGSKHASTDHNGDFGGPRGGIFALMSGLMLGVFFFSICGQFAPSVFTPAITEAGFIGSMIGGFLGGIVGMFKAPRNTDKNG